MINYREWTEMQGYDREGKLQYLQHRLSSLLSKEIYNIGGFYLPLRFDSSLAVISNVNEKEVQNIRKRLDFYFPVETVTCIGVDENPYDAQIKASRCESPDENDDSEVVAVHFDLNNFSGRELTSSVYDTFLEVTKVYLKVTEEIIKLRGIATYLGGDNVLSFISPQRIEDVQGILDRIPHLKAGIGRGRTAREAIKNAAKGLKIIRENRNLNQMLVG
ncbi:GTP cyclohydrolase [Sulfolobales archaeon HS-7]|nr:GTP cyclohydrolase [Sulfolobales archaeon HS-7]